MSTLITTSPEIDDPFMGDFFDRKRPKMSDFKIDRMLLYPKQWKNYTSPIGHTLSWEPVKFQLGNALDVPDHLGGVYSFVVRPEIADHPQCAYIMYIGKAVKFRSRYYAYQAYFRGKIWEAKQPHVAEMIQKWSDYLWFYYAEVSDVSLIETTETCLIHTFTPPANRDIGGKLGIAMNNLFT
jgi:hypothetical protein